MRIQPLTLRIEAVHAFLDRLEARGSSNIPEDVVAGSTPPIDRAGFRTDKPAASILIRRGRDTTAEAENASRPRRAARHSRAETDGTMTSWT